MSEYTGEVLTERPKVAPAGSTPPIGMAAVPVIEKEFKDEYDAKKATLKKDYEEKKEEITTTSPFTIPGLLTSPPALVTGAALLGALTTYAAPKVYKGIKERYMTQAPEINRNIDIPTGGFFDVPPNPNINPVNQPEAQAVDKLRKAEELAEANRQLGIGDNKPVAPGPIARTPLPRGAVNPAMFRSSPKAPKFDTPPSTPFSAAPLDAPAPTPTAGPSSPVTTIVTDTVKEMIQEAPAQPMEAVKPVAAAPAPVAAPAYPKTGTKFKTEADIPAGFVARYDVGNVDRSMGNILGLEHRAYARDLFNKGLPFGQSANQNQVVSDLTKQYFQQLQGEIPETILGREARQAQKIPSDFGVFANKTNFGKGVTIGGKAATLFALADVANAQTPGQRGMAGANLLEAVLPPGFTMSGAGEGSDMPPRAVDPRMANINMTNASMFAPTANDLFAGNPYAQSELAKRRRQEAEYTRKVGAGRGIAPPSAYMR